MLKKIIVNDEINKKIQRALYFNIKSIPQTASWGYFSDSLDLAYKISRDTEIMIDKYGEKETVKAILLNALEYLSSMEDSDKTELVSGFLNELYYRVCEEKEIGYGE
ncbi:MAG: hypothetical protein DDT40_01905 [candidate division WS2 bacterium]|nr:hypothetical protein [Candidatus Psychracetigena formicireducens]